MVRRYLRGHAPCHGEAGNLRYHLPLLGLVLCAVPLVGCLGGDAAENAPLRHDAFAATGPLVQVLEDAEGDAVEGRPAFGTTTGARCDLVYPPEARDACREQANTAGGLPVPEEGVAASAAVDIIGVALQETPAYLIVELQLAALDPSFAQALPREGERLRLVVYLGPDLASQVDLYVVRDYGQLAVKAIAYAASCGGGDNACAWEVAYDLVQGTPGIVRWYVERELLPDAGLGGAVTGQDAGILRHVFGGPTARWRAETAAGDVGNIVRSDSAFLLDHVVGTTSFAFASAMAAFPDPAPAGRFADVDGEAWLDTARLDLDVEALVVAETPETLTLSLELARVDERPADHWVEMDLAILGGAYLEVYLVAQGGEFEDLTSACLDANDDCADWRPLPHDLLVVPGEPGRINVTFSRHDIGPVEAGDVTRYLSAEAGALSGRDVEAGPLDVFAAVEPEGRDVDEASTDGIEPAPAYRFRFDTVDAPAGALPTSVLIEDALDDVEPDPLVAAGEVPQFDVTFVEARGESPGVTRLTLGIRDLSRVSVPSGYEAAVYAAGIATELGDFMAGFYLERGGRQEFFCAQDTVVLVEEKRDPLQVIRQTIDGSISVVDRGADEGRATASAITFLTPHACFSLEGEGPLAGSRLGAGTYLIQDPGRVSGSARVTRLDDVERNEPLAVQAALVRGAPPAPWYAAPFGLSNFWDIAGIGLAGIAALVGGGLKLQHSRRDKRAVANAKLREDRDVYKAALAKAVARGTHDPNDDEVLQALRRRLGIGEREHALMLLEARAAAGLADGLDVGETFLGKYRIERVLGEGGFARTFLARDVKLERRVVLKVARWEDKKEAARALKEGRTLARLNHPNIVTIHDVEEVAGQVVLVLEHVPRGSLAGVLARGPITAAEALSVTHDVLAGLEAAHAQGIVHRDVKPANILLGTNGHAKLADFGIAGRARGAGTATGASLGGDGAGTLGYMSPEQARGAPANERSDLYSVGVVLYEMLTGRSYIDFEGLGDFEVRKAILEDEPDLPIAGAPARVNAALAQALAKDAAERPASAAAMARLVG